MSARGRALCLVAGCTALVISCTLPVASAGGRQLSGLEFVLAALRALPNAGAWRATELVTAMAANLIIPACAALALAGRANRFAPVFCAVTLLAASTLLLRAWHSQIVTLHVGVAVWFVAMLMLCVAALQS